METGDVVSKLPLFRICAGLEDADLQSLASLLSLETIAAGTEFLRHDDANGKVYFIVDGMVEVTVPLVANKGRAQLAKLGRGDTVGEFALVRDARRSASSVAISEVVALSGDNVALLNHFELHPRLGYLVFRNLSRILVERLVDTNMTLRNAMAGRS